MNKKKIISLSVAGIILLSGCNTKAVINEQKPYDKYSDGKVYIENIDFLKSDEYKNINDNDIVIIDQRDGSDPNMKIIDSYKINSPNKIEEILKVLLKYEENNPSNWNRTLESMKIEWIFHNTAFFLNYRQGDSKDVDLNNADEEYFLAKKMSYFFKNK